MSSGIATDKVIDILELKACMEQAIKEITTTMFACDSEIIPHESVTLLGPPGLSAIVGFGGKISGNISLHLTKESACALAKNMLGMEFDELDDIVADAMGEIVNMLAGGMKKYACSDEDLFKISVPSIVFGSDYCTRNPKNSEMLFMGVRTDDTKFSVQLILAQQ